MFNKSKAVSAKESGENVADWIAIKTEYVTTNISLRALARKYAVSFSTLEKKARSGAWADEKKATCDKMATKARQKSEEAVADSHAERIALLMSGGAKAARMLVKHLEDMEKSGEIRPYEIKATVEAMKGIRELYKTNDGDERIDRVAQIMARLDAESGVQDAQ